MKFQNMATPVASTLDATMPIPAITTPPHTSASLIASPAMLIASTAVYCRATPGPRSDRPNTHTWPSQKLTALAARKASVLAAMSGMCSTKARSSPRSITKAIAPTTP